jgi:hypothetical protein
MEESTDFLAGQLLAGVVGFWVTHSRGEWVVPGVVVGVENNDSVCRVRLGHPSLPLRHTDWKE